MMAARAMSASSSAAAARNKRRHRRPHHVTFHEPKKPKGPKTKLTPDLCYLLMKKIAPRLLIGVGFGFIFLGILLTCLGFTASRHYPQGKGAGLTLLIMGIFMVVGGIAWRIWRLRYRSQKAKTSASQSDLNGSAAKYEANNTTAVSVADIRISASEVASFDHVVENEESDGGISMSKRSSRKLPVVPEIEVSYIDCDKNKPSSIEL